MQNRGGGFKGWRDVLDVNRLRIAHRFEYPFLFNALFTTMLHAAAKAPIIWLFRFSCISDNKYGNYYRFIRVAAFMKKQIETMALPSISISWV